MKTQNLILTLIAILSVISSACEKESNEPSQTQVLVPINEGNVWTYRCTSFDDSAEIIDTTNFTVGQKVTINGYKGFIINNGERPYNAAFWGYNDSKGNFVSMGGFSDIDTLISPSVQFKIDAIKGDKWDYNDVVFNYNDGTFEEIAIEITCLSIDTLISTPKGAFKCRLFEQSPNEGEDVFRFFVSENVGIVKSEHFEYDELFSFNELIDLDLK